MATGRGLPTERRPFLGAIGESGELIPGGLYLDYARLTSGPLVLVIGVLGVSSLGIMMALACYA